MNRLAHKSINKSLRSHRSRSRFSGTAERPRLSVHVSLKHVTAQLIDDTSGKTIAYVSTAGEKENGQTLTDKASAIGSEIGKRAKTAKIHKVVFDRGSKLYHGRVRALAEAARKEGLEF